MTPPTTTPTPKTEHSHSHAVFHCMKNRAGGGPDSTESRLSQRPIFMAVRTPALFGLDEPDNDFLVLPTGCHYLGKSSNPYAAARAVIGALRGPGSTLFGHALLIAAQSTGRVQRLGTTFDAATLAASYEKARQSDIVTSLTYANEGEDAKIRRTWRLFGYLFLAALALGAIAFGLLAGGATTP